MSRIHGWLSCWLQLWLQIVLALQKHIKWIESFKIWGPIFVACVAAVSAKALQIVLHLKSRNNVGPWFYDYLADPNLLNLSGQCTSCHIFDSYEVAQVTLCLMKKISFGHGQTWFNQVNYTFLLFLPKVYELFSNVVFTDCYHLSHEMLSSVFTFFRLEFLCCLNSCYNGW